MRTGRSALIAAMAILVVSCGGQSEPTVTSDSAIRSTSTSAATAPTSVTTTTPSTSMPNGGFGSSNAEERWLTSVRAIENSVIEADLGWVPWTATFNDADLATLQLEWCSTVSSVGDISIEDSPGWLSDHPVVGDIENLLNESGAASQDQLNYSTEVLLPQMLMVGLCGELQPSYNEQSLLEVFETEALAVLSNNVAVIPSTPEGELFEDIRSSAFATCTNIDNRPPGPIGVMLMESVFDADDSISALMVVASMRTAASYLCPGRSADAITQWADDGYPTS